MLRTGCRWAAIPAMAAVAGADRCTAIPKKVINKAAVELAADWLSKLGL